MRCVFCLSNDMRTKTDKKGRPYLSCDICGVKCFPRNNYDGIFRYQSVAELIDAGGYSEKIKEGADYIRAQHTFDRDIDKARKKVDSKEGVKQ